MSASVKQDVPSHPAQNRPAESILRLAGIAGCGKVEVNV